MQEHKAAENEIFMRCNRFLRLSNSLFLKLTNDNIPQFSPPFF